MINKLTDFREDVDKLINRVSEKYVLPYYINLKVIVIDAKLSEFDYKNRMIINKNDIYSLDRYCEEYSEKKSSGYAWINLQCAGLYNDDLMVVIEYPQNPSNVRKTSINMSGPYNQTLNSSSGWEFEASYKVVS